jgi:hypothetical protein
MGHLAGWAAEIKAIADGQVFSGALVQLTSPETIPNSVPTDISWDATVYDVGGWWSGANPTRLTVPAGVSRVIVSCNIQWATNNVGGRLVIHKKNGGTFPGQGASRLVPTENADANVHSAVVDVVAGDFFEVRVTQTSGGNLDLNDAPSNWFAIRAS